VIRERVTHAKPKRDAFDGYARGSVVETCNENRKLKIRRKSARRLAIGATGDE